MLSRRDQRSNLILGVQLQCVTVTVRSRLCLALAFWSRGCLLLLQGLCMHSTPVHGMVSLACVRKCTSEGDPPSDVAGSAQQQTTGSVTSTWCYTYYTTTLKDLFERLTDCHREDKGVTTLFTRSSCFRPPPAQPMRAYHLPTTATSAGDLAPRSSSAGCNADSNSSSRQGSQRLRHDAQARRVNQT